MDIDRQFLKGGPLHIQCIYTSNTVVAQNNSNKFNFLIAFRTCKSYPEKPVQVYF